MNELDKISREMNETTSQIEALAEELANIADERGYNCLVYLSTPILEDAATITNYAALSTNSDDSSKYGAVKAILGSMKSKAELLRIKDYLESIT